MTSHNTIELDGFSLSASACEAIAYGSTVKLASSCKERVDQTRSVVEELIGHGTPLYGVNTGFGYLAHQAIDEKALEKLQNNILLSHAAGSGPTLTPQQTRLAMALRLNVLLRATSGVSWELCLALHRLLEADILPLIPLKGSVGASGDLIPLAHLAIALIGQGNVLTQEGIFSAKEALQQKGLAPYKLKAKEGLALINGTQIMIAVGGLSLFKAIRLAALYDRVCALSYEALEAHLTPLDPYIHEMRGQKGQINAASNMLSALEGSYLHQLKHHRRVQDPYSLRCAPQVHGASQDLLDYAFGVVSKELNSSTDNPLIDVERKRALSGGNFHGEPLAFAFDAAAIAVAELGSISERRLELLLNPHMSGLPAFLTPHSGLNSGYMCTQYLADALIAENRVLCHPASVDSVPGNVGIEDHVSMGMTAAHKLQTVVENGIRILAIELLCASQAITLRGQPQLGQTTNLLYKALRESIAPLEEDRLVSLDIQKAEQLIQQMITNPPLSGV